MIRFALPWGLLGLLSIPILLGIYFLIGRSKTYVVSSLFLWEDPKISPVGGRRFEKLRTPLSFFLELLILILFTMAIAGPEMNLSKQKLPLVVVLDNSYSMLAGGNNSPRAQAMAALRPMLDGRFDPITFILAGTMPQLISPEVEGGQAQWEQAWNGTEPQANLSEGIAMAKEVGGQRANILLLTDTKPAFEPSPGSLRWLAFGEARDNLAFVNASRTNHQGRDKVLLEVVSYSNTTQTVTLTSDMDQTTPQTLRLEPDQPQRLVYALSGNRKVTSFKLSGDALTFDDEVQLVARPAKGVRVQNKLTGDFGNEITRALEATDQVVMVNSDPQIVIDRGGTPQQDSSVWRFSIRKPANAKALLGPFISDTRHPLTEGLSLGGVVWSSSGSSSENSAPILLAGNTPLLEEVSTNRGTQIFMNIDPSRSTLTRAPAWPILFANLVNWYQQAAPGLDRVNIALGDTAKMTLSEPNTVVELTHPNGQKDTHEAVGLSFILSLKGPGRHEVSAGELKETLAVNPLNGSESDLRDAVSGSWGDWRNIQGSERGWREVGTYCLLLALALLALHIWVVHRERREATA